MQNFKWNSVILIKHSCGVICTSINKKKNIRRDEFTALSFKVPIFREWRAIQVRNQPSIECRLVAALQMSDYVGSASNCVGDMSRTMPADSLLTLYSVGSVNSFLSVTSCHHNPPQKRILKLVSLASARHAPAVAGAPARFGGVSSAEHVEELSWFREHAWELLLPNWKYYNAQVHNEPWKRTVPYYPVASLVVITKMNPDFI